MRLKYDAISLHGKYLVKLFDRELILNQRAAESYII